MSELTKQALKVDNNMSFPNNNAGLITPTALRTFNENMIDSTVNQAVYTADSGSWNQQINALEQFTASASGLTTGSLLITASFNNSTRNLTFTKGDSSTFAVNIPDVSGSVLPSGVVSGSSQINYPQISNIPSGIVSGSGQITPLLPSGVVSGSSQVSYTGLSNIPAGIVSGAAQVTPLLPSGVVSGSSQLTASYDQRYALSGSGGGGTGNGFPFSGSAVITGSLSVSETIKSQVYINPQTIDGFTIPTGNNAMLVGPVAVSGSIVVEGTSNLIVLSQVTSSSTPLPSGVVSGSSQLTASYDLRYALSGSGGATILTGSFATTGSNTFIGNQTITGSLFLSSSNPIEIIVPNFPGSPAPGGVSVTGSMAVNGNFAVNGGNFVVGQINTPKIVGNGSPGLDIVSNVQIYNDGNINNARILGVSGSVHVSQSLYTGDLYVGGNKQFNVAEFFSTTTQSGSAGVSGSITFNNSGSVNGVSLANNTRITVANAGTYNIQFSAQVETNAGSDSAYIWFKKNGVNIPSSATKVVLANNTAQVMTVNILDEAIANDYYELAYQTNNGNAALLAEVASGNIPAIPSVIATVTQVR